jgi:hypothetical protein
VGDLGFGVQFERDELVRMNEMIRILIVKHEMVKKGEKSEVKTLCPQIGVNVPST